MAQIENKDSLVGPLPREADNDNCDPLTGWQENEAKFKLEKLENECKFLDYRISIKYRTLET